jgi:transcriptional regulator with XRE-family HTH domain
MTRPRIKTLEDNLKGRRLSARIRLTPGQRAGLMTEGEIREMLDRRASGFFGAQTQAAADLGVSPAFLSEIVRGRISPSRAIAEKLGYTEIRAYVKEEDQE